ncbi:MAG: 5-formyltetrahydrofolate cyclo-ligase [Candidatus Atribacteria bacterium]|nr:5-formyltetrahydrofolate cyclo-ligase [Candidatus Atribacteria bacterium]
MTKIPNNYIIIKIMNKEEIRRKIIKKRLSLSSEYIKNISEQVCINLAETVEYIDSQNIMFYVATRSEVQTEEMIKISVNVGKNIFVPIILTECINLAPSTIYDFDNELEKGEKGILEPKKEYYRLFPPEDIDLIIVPGVAFDLSGNRIGRGFGYYDNFLRKISTSTKIIALAFEMQIVEKIPNDKNDIPVHKIITEKRIINSIEYPVSSI